MKTHILALTLACIILPTLAFGQEPGQVFVRRDKMKADGILKSYDTKARTCGSDSYSVGQYAVLIFSSNRDDGNVVVGLKHNTSGTDMAQINHYYCISSNDMKVYFMPKVGPQVGILTVPLKLRTAPVKIMAGGTIGPFVGKRWDLDNGTAITALAFASLTNVPLNDLNSTVPETRWGLGVGGGLAWTITGDFQIGIVSGVDLFEGVESWAYGYKPWLSLSIGYQFLKPANEKGTLATMAQ